MKFISKTNMIVLFIVILVLTCAVNIVNYNQVKVTIAEHHCVATNVSTQEFSSSGNNSVDSETKVFYKCDDHPRWLTSYDMLDSFLGK